MSDSNDRRAIDPKGQCGGATVLFRDGTTAQVKCAQNCEWECTQGCVTCGGCCPEGMFVRISTSTIYVTARRTGPNDDMAYELPRPFSATLAFLPTIVYQRLRSRMSPQSTERPLFPQDVGSAYIAARILEDWLRTNEGQFNLDELLPVLNRQLNEIAASFEVVNSTDARYDAVLAAYERRRNN